MYTKKGIASRIEVELPAYEKLVDHNIRPESVLKKFSNSSKNGCESPKRIVMSARHKRFVLVEPALRF